MRRRSVMYASLILAAIVFGILAAGLPSHRSDPVLRASGSVPTTRVSRPRASTTRVSRPTASTTRSTIAVPRPHSPGAVTVLVANASGVTGAGATRATALGNAGYKTPSPVNATASKVTAVYFLAGYRADASAVALLIGAPAGAVQAMPAKPPVSNLSTANLLVVVGSDLAHK